MILGLTGNSGSGKSYAASYLSKKGAYVIDCDKLAHVILTEDLQVINRITEEFGTAVLDKNGIIVRKKLGEIVFNNREKLLRLNEIVHKGVISRVIEETNRQNGVIVIDAPLLIESSLHKICTFLWVIDALKSTKIRRIMDRDSISCEEAQNRLANQTDPEILKKEAHAFIENNGTLQCLEEKLDRLYKLL